MILRSIKELALFAISRRKQLGLTQSQVAEKVGLKQKTISAFENKPESTMLETAFVILSALQIELDAAPQGQKSGKASGWKEEW